MSDDLPPPMTPATCDISRLPYMPVLISKLFKSDFWLDSSGEEFKYGFKLWGESWMQIPAASLPDDDKKLAGLAGVPRAKWNRIRERALHNWVKCSDGRLYHPVIAELALTPWIERLEQQLKGAKGNASQGKKTTVSPKIIQCEIDIAMNCLRRLQDPLRDYAGRDALRDAGCGVSDTQAEAEVEDEVERETLPAQAPAMGKRPPDADADAALEMALWAPRLEKIRTAFADVLSKKNRQNFADPVELQIMERQGFDWRRHIEPGLNAYLSLHRERMKSGSVGPLESFTHPGIREQVERIRTNQERLEAANQLNGASQHGR